MADGEGGIDQGTGHVQVHVAVGGEGVLLQLSLGKNVFNHREKTFSIIGKNISYNGPLISMDKRCLTYLDLAGFGAGLGRKGRVEGQLESLDNLVLDVDDGVEVVVGVPLLGEGQTVLRALVLGLQVGGDLERQCFITTG